MKLFWIALFAVPLFAEQYPIVPPCIHYPPLARAARLQDRITINVTVARDGRVVDVTIIDGHPLFKDAVKKSLMEVKFTPADDNDPETNILTFVYEFKFDPKINGEDVYWERNGQTITVTTDFPPETASTNPR